MRNGKWIFVCLGALVWIPTCGGSSSNSEIPASDASELDVAQWSDPDQEPETEPLIDVDPSPPPEPDWDRDILSTSLSVDLDAMTGTATIILAPADSQGASFSVGNLTIDTVDGPTSELEYQINEGQLDVGIPLSNDNVEISIDYTFTSHDQFDGYSSLMGASFIWPYFCGNLFPCNPSPAEGLTFSLQVTGVPTDQVAVYPQEIPAQAPPYILGMAIGDYVYETLGTTRQNTEVGVWYLTGHRDVAMAGTAGLTEAFQWFEETLGPYVFGDRVGSVEANWSDTMSGGMEHHPYWHISSDAMNVGVYHVHESAHGWFGNGVRIQCWEDFVLSEGTTTYLTARAIEATQGELAGQAVWSAYQTMIEAAMTLGDTVAWPQTCNTIDILTDPLWSDVPYVKGAFFLRDVELEVGRDSIDAALSRFYGEYVGEAASMADLISVIEDETGFDTTELVNEWLLTLGAPE